MNNKLTKVVIVDDEPLALELLEGFVAKTEGLVLVDKFRNPKEALAFLEVEGADMLLVDIEMPNLNGMDLAKARPENCAVVFTTAYSEYATQAFELDAVDYLLKPFGYDRFLHAVEKAKEYNWLREHKEEYQASEVQFQERFLIIRTGSRLMRLPIADILFIEGLGEYVKVVCTTAKYITLERMKNMEELLPIDSFMRVHKSYIAALPQIRAIEGYTLELASGDKIPVSRDRKEEVMRLVFNA